MGATQPRYPNQIKNIFRVVDDIQRTTYKIAKQAATSCPIPTDKLQSAIVTPKRTTMIQIEATATTTCSSALRNCKTCQPKTTCSAGSRFDRLRTSILLHQLVRKCVSNILIVEVTFSEAQVFPVLAPRVWSDYRRGQSQTKGCACTL